MTEPLVAELMRKLVRLEQEVASLRAGKPKYTVISQQVMAQITGDTNDYDIWDADILYVSTDAARNLSGIANGVIGRVLTLYNYGSFNLVVLHNSGLSAAANRIVTTTGGSLTIAPSRSIQMEHTGSWWRVLWYS